MLCRITNAVDKQCCRWISSAVTNFIALLICAAAVLLILLGVALIGVLLAVLIG